MSLLDADTGAVLAMAGQKHEQEAQDFKANTFAKTITDIFIPGSALLREQPNLWLAFRCCIYDQV